MEWILIVIFALLAWFVFGLNSEIKIGLSEINSTLKRIAEAAENRHNRRQFDYDDAN